MCANKLDLRKEPSDKHTIDLGDGIVGFKFHNVTKYYENDIVFVSHESKHINLIPLGLVDRVEGVIVYFDSDNVSHCLRALLFIHVKYVCQFIEYYLLHCIFLRTHFRLPLVKLGKSRKTFWRSYQFMQISSNATTLNWAFCCAANCTTIHTMASHTRKARNLATYWM